MVEVYNSTMMTGGDSLTEDLNIYYEVCFAPTYQNLGNFLGEVVELTPPSVRRYCVDDHSNRSRTPHDPRCRVSAYFSLLQNSWLPHISYLHNII